MSDADQMGLRDMIFHHINRVNGKEERAVMIAVSIKFLFTVFEFCLAHFIILIFDGLLFL